MTSKGSKVPRVLPKTQRVAAEAEGGRWSRSGGIPARDQQGKDCVQPVGGYLRGDTRPCEAVAHASFGNCGTRREDVLPV